MKLRYKSIRQQNIIGLQIIYPDGTSNIVAQVMVPMDGDWRADVEFYDDLVKIYKKRIHSVISSNV